MTRKKIPDTARLRANEILTSEPLPAADSAPSEREMQRVLRGPVVDFTHPLPSEEAPSMSWHDLADEDAVDEAPDIRCRPAPGVILRSADGALLLTLDPLDGGDCPVVHLGDVATYLRNCHVVEPLISSSAPQFAGIPLHDADGYQPALTQANLNAALARARAAEDHLRREGASAGALQDRVRELEALHAEREYLEDGRAQLALDASMRQVALAGPRTPTAPPGPVGNLTPRELQIWNDGLLTGRAEAMDGVDGNPRETQATIAAWADETFGPCTPTRAATRCADEITEFMNALLDGAGSIGQRELSDEARAALLDEGADIVITLLRFAATCNANLQDIVDHKMRVNRTRQWVADGTGCGYHRKAAQS